MKNNTDYLKKVTTLNQTILKLLDETDIVNIAREFTNTGIKILGADFGFAWFKTNSKIGYKLAYKSPRTPYDPLPPRKKGINAWVYKTKKPFYATRPPKERLHKYNVARYLKSFVIIPIAYQNRIHGHSVICFRKMHKFTNEEKSLCVAIGNAMAQALTINRLNHYLRDIKQTLDHTPQPKIIFDPATFRVSYFNNSLVEHAGLRAGQLRHAKFPDLIHPQSRKVTEKRLKKIVAEKTPSTLFETVLKGRNGRKLPMETLLQYIRHKDGNDHLLAIMTDLTERIRSEKQIKKAAFHDTLTGLPNRMLFTKKLGHLLKVSRQKNRMFAVMFVDLDRFKFINDTIGHMAGDELLRQVARRLRRNIKRSDVVSRFGGDEFVILLGNIRSKKDPGRVAERIKKSFEAPFKISSQQDLYVGFSMGISVFPKDGVEDMALLKNADAALYWAKQESGGNAYQYYGADILTLQPARLEMEKELRRAITEKELKLEYQPIVDLKTGKIREVEALVRWEHPEMGVIPPSVFIPYAEESGLIVNLGEFVFTECCRQLRSWRKSKLDLSISINVSARELLQKNTIEKMQKILKTYRLPAEKFTLEVTETFLIKNMKSFMTMLTEIREIGFKTSLDDFGTGYASLNYLKFLPVDYVKIDKLFVEGCTTNKEDMGIIQAIIAVARHLDTKVIAEGVENAQQAVFLKKHSCDMIQGNLFSPPLPPGRIPEVLQARHKQAWR